MKRGRRIGQRIDSDRQQLNRIATMDFRQASMNRAKQRALQRTHRSTTCVDGLERGDALEKDAAEQPLLAGLVDYKGVVEPGRRADKTDCPVLRVQRGTYRRRREGRDVTQQVTPRNFYCLIRAESFRARVNFQMEQGIALRKSMTNFTPSKSHPA